MRQNSQAVRHLVGPGTASPPPSSRRIQHHIRYFHVVAHGQALQEFGVVGQDHMLISLKYFLIETLILQWAYLNITYESSSKWIFTELCGGKYSKLKVSSSPLPLAIKMLFDFELPSFW
jgi:hypothetical protein